MPTTRTITQTVYKYSELTGKARDNACYHMGEYQTSHDWWEFVYESWNELLTAVGFENAKISFTGFASQGDGASFTADCDIEKLAKAFSSPIEPSECWKENGELAYLADKLEGIEHAPQFARLAGLGDWISLKVVRTSHHYCHYNTCGLEWELCDNGRECDKVYRLLSQFVESVELLRKDICKAIYDALESEYDYLTSDESCAEHAEEHDYLFFANGDIA